MTTEQPATESRDRPPRRRPSGYRDADGDYIARMVLELVRAIHRDVVEDPAHRRHRPPADPVPCSPVYREYERLVDVPKAS